MLPGPRSGESHSDFCGAASHRPGHWRSSAARHVLHPISICAGLAGRVAAAITVGDLPGRPTKPRIALGPCCTALDPLRRKRAEDCLRRGGRPADEDLSCRVPVLLPGVAYQSPAAAIKAASDDRPSAAACGAPGFRRGCHCHRFGPRRRHHRACAHRPGLPGAGARKRRRGCRASLHRPHGRGEPAARQPFRATHRRRAPARRQFEPLGRALRALRSDRLPGQALAGPRRLADRGGRSRALPGAGARRARGRGRGLRGPPRGDRGPGVPLRHAGALEQRAADPETARPGAGRARRPAGGAARDGDWLPLSAGRRHRRDRARRRGRGQGGNPRLPRRARGRRQRQHPPAPPRAGARSRALRRRRRPARALLHGPCLWPDRRHRLRERDAPRRARLLR